MDASVLSRAQDKIDWKLVRSVSRSFYLTLRLLPSPVRSGITLAYLLARASDTIADSLTLEAKNRLEMLEFLRQLTLDRTIKYNERATDVLVQSQMHKGEQQLLRQLPELLDQLKHHPDEAEICQVWNLILKGQIFDLEHDFAEPLYPEQLERYTFLVAGCVGKFWTDICWKRLPFFASRSYAEMESLGIHYGKGLQLINILRDRKEDAIRARIYISREDVILYREDASRAMRSGIEYASAVKLPFLRYATLLPALIGHQTLELIQPESGKVKISRRSIYKTLMNAVPSLWNRSFFDTHNKMRIK